MKCGVCGWVSLTVVLKQKYSYWGFSFGISSRTFVTVFLGFFVLLIIFEIKLSLVFSSESNWLSLIGFNTFRSTCLLGNKDLAD